MPAEIFGLPYLVVVWGGFMVLFVIGGVLYGILKMAKLRREKAAFLAAHPDASTIYLMAKGYIVSDAVCVHAVDGKPPMTLSDSGKHGILIAPGERRLRLSYTHTRPGVVYRNVSTSTGTVDKLVTVKPSTTYKISFDRKEKTFLLEEITVN